MNCNSSDLVDDVQKTVKENSVKKHKTETAEKHRTRNHALPCLWIAAKFLYGLISFCSRCSRCLSFNSLFS